MWEVSLHPEVEAWFLNLCRDDPVSADLVAEAIDLSGRTGTSLGQAAGGPDTASRFHNMKKAIPVADQRFEDHLTSLKEEQR